MKSNDFLLILDNALSHNVCDELIELFEESRHKCRLEKNGYPNWTHLFLRGNHQDIEDKLYNTFLRTAVKYREYIGEYGKYFNLHNFVFEGSNIKKYVGGTDDQYKRHADVSSMPSCRRFLAFIYYLNDGFEGGETIFYPNSSVTPKKGSVLVFPPFWNFPHEGTPVIKGTKYIMSNYCLWSPDKPILQIQ